MRLSHNVINRIIGFLADWRPPTFTTVTLHLLLHLTEVLPGVPDVLPAGGSGELELLESLVQLGHRAGV